MRLIIRAPGTQDLEVCARIAPDSFAFDEATRADLIKMWRKLIATDCALAKVVEVEQGSASTRIVGFGLSVFVSDAFVDAAQTCLPPYVSKQVLKEWLGGKSPILTLAEVRRANSAEGLNWLGLHMSWDEACVTVAGHCYVRDKLLQAQFEAVRGYHLKQFLTEAYGDKERRRVERFGAYLRNDYESYFERNPLERPEPCVHPYLMGVTHDEAFDPSLEGSYARYLFLYTPPRFHFKPSEQELLQHALSGASDEELAQSLYRSPWTIKKQWRAIYERVYSVDPALFSKRSTACGMGQGAAQGRGQEKRRVLLNYLRLHPEELRPNMPPASKADAAKANPRPKRASTDES